MSDKEDDRQSLLSKAPRGDEAELEVPQAERIPVKEIHAKYSTKYELFRFLASRNNVYLPHH